MKSAGNETPRTPWGWAPPRDEGIWRFGAAWARPFIVAAPYLAFALVLVQFAFLERRLYSDVPGQVFDLPSGEIHETDLPSLTAMVMPASDGGGSTCVFFDDERYVLGADGTADALRERLARRAQGGATLLLLADRRIDAGALMKIVGLARASGVRHVQVGEKDE